jgi:hypothetical protein
MGFLLLKIDQYLVEKQIPVSNAAKAPALMKTKGTGFELLELFRTGRRDFSGLD